MIVEYRPLMDIDLHKTSQLTTLLWHTMLCGRVQHLSLEIANDAVMTAVYVDQMTLVLILSNVLLQLCQ